MFKLKGAIEKANGLYNNLRENDEETLKIKDMLITILFLIKYIVFLVYKQYMMNWMLMYYQ